MEPRISEESILCGVALAATGLVSVPNPYKKDLSDGPVKLIRADGTIAPSDAAAEAAGLSLKKAGLSIDRVDLLISCTQTPDLNNPGLANSILYKLGAKGIPGLEIKQSSAGALYALDLASRLVTLREKKCVLVVATDFLSRFFGGFEDSDSVTPGQKALRARLSDGAGAFIVTTQSYLESAGGKTDIVKIGAVFAAALPQGWDSFSAALPSSSQFPLRITKDDVVHGRHLPGIEADAFLTASARMLDKLIERLTPKTIEKGPTLIFHGPLPAAKYGQILGLSKELIDIYGENGFLGAAGIVYGLHRALERKTKGNLVLLALGAGIQGGSAILGGK